MFYLMIHSTHFYLQMSDMVKDHSATTHCCHYMDNSFQLATRDLVHVPSHRQDSTYHGLCYTSRGSLA